MTVRVIGRIESVLFSANRRTARAAQWGLILAAALLAALSVAVLGPAYAVIGLAGLIAGLFVLRDLRWGLTAVIGVIALLPFAALPFKLGFTPTFLDLALLAAFFVWIMRIATRRQRELVGTALDVPILVFAALAVFAFAAGMQHSRPTSTTIRNFAELLLGIFAFFLVVNNLHTQRDLDWLTRVIMIAGAGAAAIAILFYVIPAAWSVRILDALARLNYPGGYGALRYIEDDPANPMRAIGTMVDPNVLGGFLILMAALVAPQLVSPQPLLRRRWVALFLVLELLALYLTYSRGSLAGLAAGLIVIGLLRYRRLLLLAVGGAMLLLLLPPAQTYVAHLIEGLQLQDRATLMRLGEYRDALALISRYPWFGVGFSAAPEADLYIGVSNVYLLMAEEMGLLGVASYLLIMVLFLANLFAAWRRVTRRMASETDRSRLEALLLGVLAATVGVLAGGLFDHYLFNLVYPHMSTLFWIYVGLGMSAVRVTNGE